MEHPILTFLFDYLSDLNLSYTIADGKGLTLSSMDQGLRNSILKLPDAPSSNVINHVDENTLYHVTDYYYCNYSFFQFQDEKKFLFIGPCLLGAADESDLYNLIDSLQIPGELFPQLRDYYHELPLISDKYAFHLFLQHVHSSLSGTKTTDVCCLDLKTLETQSEYLKQHPFLVQEDPVLSMNLLEKRYHIEDDLLDAVSHGNTAKAVSHLASISSIRLSPRSDNELRNQKSLMITFNSLLRRTAYLSGVHPFYIDAVSGNYARMIEQCQSREEAGDIAPYMVRSYCDLVNRRSTSSYSEPVRHILVTIDASLAADLSLKRFANELFLNTSYLSALFKKEVGMTLTDYVNKNRIEYAKKLLKSTTLSVQDVAIRSGIPDIHYFTRLFRRELGVSPREWCNR